MSESSSVRKVAARLRGEIECYSDGSKLPSSRELISRYRISPVTMSRVIAVLAEEGMVTVRPGAGVFRATHARGGVDVPDVSWQEVALNAGGDGEPRVVDASAVLTALTDPPGEVIDLNGGYLPSALQPEGALAAALSRAGRRPGVWNRPPAPGLPELRRWFARHIGSDTGAITGDNVVITGGGQSALGVVVRALARPGAPVLVESPTYAGLLAVLLSAGRRPVPVPMDEHGLRPDLLADTFRGTRARLLVCQPTFQNPTGTTWPRQRRLDVLAVAREAGSFVVEDDFARLLGHADAIAAPPPLAADDRDGVVVHVRSLSKAASPTLRIAAVSAHGAALERIRSLHAIEHFFVPRPLQEAALELVTAPAWRRHLRSLAAELRDRCDISVSAVRDQLPGVIVPVVPAGGYHLWLRLPDRIDESQLVAEALRAGVAVMPGKVYFATGPPAPHLRLSFAAPATRGQVSEGVHRLADALRRLG
ncbi:PLP-dependent aminotransferase family protein [Amycolatopsis plumensis]|uniref:PLP-dependent aminotransferase family protein n=1 Tax=Amycolatopsis plumensis TaxID=236508 RepID=A0ABV5U603_9PSEU